MTWDYRVVNRPYHAGGSIVGREYAIHEVYYDADGVPNGVTENPSYLAGESVQEMKADLMLIRGAFRRPVLQWEDIGNTPVSLPPGATDFS